MNNGRSFWTARSERVNVGHDVVSVFLLLWGCQLEVNVGEIILHLWDLFVCNSESQSLKPNVTDKIITVYQQSESPSHTKSYKSLLKLREKERERIIWISIGFLRILDKKVFFLAEQCTQPFPLCIINYTV